MSDKKIFDVVLGNHPHVQELKSGKLRADGFDLKFTEYKVTHDAFKPMVREQSFDICEMAIVTLILAKAYGKPLQLLPAVMVARLQQPFASVNAKVQMNGPGDIAGKRVGIRSYSQTTVTWLRGILKFDYGADLDAAHWVSFEEAHVAECDDPIARAPEGRKINDMLLDGELDIVLGPRIDDPRAKPLFADPEAAAAEWFARHKLIPVNHIVAVTEDMVEKNLDGIAEFYSLLKQAKAKAPYKGTGPDPLPIGFEAMRPSAELILSYMSKMKMIPKPMSVDELFDPRIRKAVGE